MVQETRLSCSWGPSSVPESVFKLTDHLGKQSPQQPWSPNHDSAIPTDSSPGLESEPRHTIAGKSITETYKAELSQEDPRTSHTIQPPHVIQEFSSQKALGYGTAGD